MGHWLEYKKRLWYTSRRVWFESRWPTRSPNSLATEESRRNGEWFIVSNASKFSHRTRWRGLGVTGCEEKHADCIQHSSLLATCLCHLTRLVKPELCIYNESRLTTVSWQPGYAKWLMIISGNETRMMTKRQTATQRNSKRLRIKFLDKLKSSNRLV